ncbi:MAG TPA: DsbA family oxidoreductase [Dongiaceae bacterium]|jgi:predicted DsbA family dithiol-disulfide isomerase
MLLEIFSDTVCPWCYIGKRRLERALRLRPQPGLTRRWRAFQLNPGLPATGMDRRQYMVAKFGSLDRAHRLYEAVSRVGAQEGIRFEFDRIARTPNTVRSHRLLYAAAEESKQADLLELIFGAYFTQGRDIGDPDVLSDLGDEAGLSPSAIADALVDGGRLDSAMTEDLQSRRIGINGVPFFVFNGRFGLSGAQEPEALLNMLDLAREEDMQKGVA